MSSDDRISRSRRWRNIAWANDTSELEDQLIANLVILDELGYLSFGEVGSALLFRLISKLYEKNGLIVTNLIISE